MAARDLPTRHPGIFKRGSRYVVRYRAGGKQRRESARTLDEALRIKRGREADRDRGEFQAQSRVRFGEYAEEWVERYHGRGQRGFREETRDDYRRDLKRYACPFFDQRLGRTVSAITPRDVANFTAWLCEQPVRGGGTLADASIRRILAPVRSCLESARQEGLIRHNPTRDAALPQRDKLDEGEDKLRVFTREQLAVILAAPRWSLLFTVLASTGLRWSELIALRKSDLVLDGVTPLVKVRRRIVRGTVGPPKSRNSRREIPLALELADRLRVHCRGLGADDLVFSTRAGTPLDHSNTLRRALRPVAEEAGASWAGFHTFRHTFASLLIARRANILQVSRLLGHHDAAFTLSVYAHVIPGDRCEPLDLSTELTATQPSQTLQPVKDLLPTPQTRLAWPMGAK